MKKPFTVLGIESSCDETAVSVIRIDMKESMNVLSNVVSSQVKLHAKYGGVVPSLAAREHVKNIRRVFELALKKAEIKDFKKEVDLIAVTHGPGLGPALLVGITFAKALAWLNEKPIIGTNHLEGHIYSNWLNEDFEPKKVKFPILHLIVSGGHTELVLMRDHGKYEIVGETLDDAVGEAFDKVARLLGLGYPGGPAVSARAGNYELGITNYELKFPRPMSKSNDSNFSYSGLKTAVLYKLRELKEKNIQLTEDLINQVCYEFQEAATEVLIQKTMAAARKFKVKSIMLSGGVSANRVLREKLHAAAAEATLNYYQPPLEYTGDNATMIAVAGYFNYKNPSKSGQEKTATNWQSVKMNANLGF